MTRFLFILVLLLPIPALAQMVPVDTAIVVTVGPLIDATDFKTLETSIVYNATGMSVDLIESSGTGAGAKTDLTLTTGSTQDWTALGNGVYEIEITSAQNNTLGSLQVVGVCDGVLPFFSPVYTVVPVVVYNSIVAGSDNLQVDAVQVEGIDATNQINAEADTALADYAPATAAALDVVDNFLDTEIAAILEDTGTTLPATLAGLATASALSTAQGDITAILADTSAVDTASELQTLLMGSAISPASTTQAATAQADLDILTGSNGVTLATSQPNYAPATAAALSTAQGDITAVLADTSAVDTTSELQTLLMGSAVAPASSTALAALNNLSAAQVNTEVDTALADIHLDHLLAADYDPANKPGISTALFNELVENDAGVSRYTANALEQAPSSGGGGDATAANQTTILDRLAGMMDKDHVLSVAVGDFTPTTDALEAIRDRGDAAWTSAAGGDGAITYVYTLLSSVDSAPIDDALVEVFTESAMTNRVASLRTNAFGVCTFYLDAGTYYFKRSKGGYNFTNPDVEVVSE